MNYQTTRNHNEANGTAPGKRSRTRRTILFAAIGIVVLIAAAASINYLRAPKPPTVAAGAQVKEPTLYTCPMHPQIIRDGPGECPICHMELVPVKRASSVDTTSRTTRDTATMIDLTPEGRIVAQVATVTAGYRTLGAVLSVPASVDFDEGTHRVISARYGGRIDRLFIRETGQPVRRGEPMMEIYSPELVAAQKDFLIALEASAAPMPAMLHSTSDDASRSGEQKGRLVAAARKRLELLGMATDQIAALERSGEVSYDTRVYAPASGVVLRRAVTEGSYIAEGATLLELADLSSVWVIANVSETDAFRVTRGMGMTVSGPALGGRQISGRVEYIYPVVDAASRSVRVRGLFTNPGILLKPGMYVTATIRVASRSVLAVPADAVVRTGTRDLVYVEVARNMFEPRMVTLGIREGEYYEITGGELRAGESVVAQGGFLIDSESRLQGAARNGGGSKHDMEGM